ncbi:hypothetical protein [Staphylococcus kloosii]|jgi:hypothetical protein|uniref:Uncharacterized protein n=1 Tax=Staphylococcus kloosii TaxID=29384 RepID=A0A151A6G6_9STAP|nr:hypothetical protein [Staphylococcus kloosii]AVQ36741.1 hypothetical protein C7J89_11435 [Staphylococcus kloosii]KYH15034.1 hypothetical protein A0131_09645 [Staphylococcus kloosii]MBF7022649.1 hypothetical protein [Staphylococcus kloosii]MBF7023681.1 hypothetical protein [Staphylococcus kloosii]MBF7028763.1 hypothetical protein [Staphylococcus kloosii]
MNHSSTLLSLFLSLVTLAIPLFVVANVLGGNMTMVVGLLFIAGVLIFNISALLNGDKIANIFAIVVTLFSLIVILYPFWKTLI